MDTQQFCFRENPKCKSFVGGGNLLRGSIHRLFWLSVRLLLVRVNGESECYAPIATSCNNKFSIATDINRIATNMRTINTTKRRRRGRGRRKIPEKYTIIPATGKEKKRIGRMKTN